MLLLLAGDVQLNPGPRNWKFPCGICEKPVKSNDKGIFCDVCQKWLHTRCIGMTDDEYSELQASPDSWSCKRCLQEALPFADCSLLSVSASQPSSISAGALSIGMSNHSSPTILYTNCRSLFPKLDELKVLASHYMPHIICLCETWLDPTVSDSELYIPGFNLLRRDRNRHGGGIASYIHDSIPFKVLHNDPTIELYIVDLSFRNRCLTLALTYRPPSSNSSVLLHLEDVLDQLPTSNSGSLLILGDFNIDASYGIVNPQLTSIQAKHGLTQVISSPTRCTSSSRSLIDHAYTSGCIVSSHSILPPLSSSDHVCILLSLPNLRVPPASNPRRKFWLYRSADFDSANDMLITFDNSFHPTPCDSIDSVWSA